MSSQYLDVLRMYLIFKIMMKLVSIEFNVRMLDESVIFNEHINVLTRSKRDLTEFLIRLTV